MRSSLLSIRTSTLEHAPIHFLEGTHPQRSSQSQKNSYLTLLRNTLLFGCE